MFYTAVAMAVSSLTTRRAVAAVAIVLLLIVPSIVVGVSVDSSGAPDELALLAPGDVAPEFAWRVFGDTRVGSDSLPPIARVSTGLVVAGLFGWIALGAAVCWVSYRRQSSRR